VPTVVHVDAMHPEGPEESRSCRWLRGKVRTLDAANNDLEEDLGDLQVEHAALIAQVAELKEKLSILSTLQNSPHALPKPTYRKR
jgi:hypothetical protein